MGGQCSVLKTLKYQLFGNKEFRILICGIDAAGKTTFLYKLKLGEVVTTIPTIGFNVETIDYKGVSFTSWDVGGRDGTRALIRHYYPGTEAIVYVVDSNDRERIDQTKDELWRIITDNHLKDCPVLIMANKQDLPGAMSVTELTDKLELEKIKDKPWHIQPSCAPQGEGLYDGMDWLHAQLTNVAAKQSVIEPLQETKDSLSKKGSLTTWLTSLWTKSK